jgi:DNA-binding transcriptional regulator YiaG
MSQKISLSLEDKSSKVESKLLNFYRSLSPEEIRDFRENYAHWKGLSQESMALHLGMSLRSYRRWEEGKAKPRIYIDAYIHFGPELEKYYNDKTGKNVYQEVNEEMGLV